MERRENTSSNYHLKELRDISYEVAKGEPDIRDWEVRDTQGQKLGEVKELLCDTEARKVRYLVLDLEGNVLDLEPRDVLIPIGLAELHESDDLVLLPQVTPMQLQALPVYDSSTLSQEVERKVQRAFVGDHVHGGAPDPAMVPSSSNDYSREQFNQNNLYRNRKARNVIGLYTDAGNVQRVTQDLLSNGFKADNIEAAVRHQAGAQDGYSVENFERFFQSLFATPEEALRYQKKLNHSNALVVVHAYSKDEANRASSILDHFQGSELDIHVEKDTTGGQTNITSSETTTIPIIEEQAHIGKQEVETGQANINAQIVERPIEENVRLREERIKIERVPVDRPANQEDFKSFQEATIELKEYAEVPIVQKEARVVEEITIAKEVEEHNQVIHDTVRSTEVEVEERSKDDLRSTPPSSPSS